MQGAWVQSPVRELDSTRCNWKKQNWACVGVHEWLFFLMSESQKLHLWIMLSTSIFDQACHKKHDTPVRNTDYLTLSLPPITFLHSWDHSIHLSRKCLRSLAFRKADLRLVLPFSHLAASSINFLCCKPLASQGLACYASGKPAWFCSTCTFFSQTPRIGKDLRAHFLSEMTALSLYCLICWVGKQKTLMSLGTCSLWHEFG